MCSIKLYKTYTNKLYKMYIHQLYKMFTNKLYKMYSHKLYKMYIIQLCTMFSLRLYKLCSCHLFNMYNMSNLQLQTRMFSQYIQMYPHHIINLVVSIVVSGRVICMQLQNHGPLLYILVMR